MKPKRPAPKAGKPEFASREDIEQAIAAVSGEVEKYLAQTGHSIEPPQEQAAPSAETTRQPDQSAEPKKPAEPLDIRIRQGSAALKEADLDARVGDRHGVRLREDLSIRVSGDGGGANQKPGPSSPSAAGGPGANPMMPPQPPPSRDVVFSALERTMPSRDKGVDWYVDVDFSPIVQRDIKPFLDSLKVLGEMLPGDNPESRRMLVTMALVALGVNDVDEQLDALFPPLPPGTEPSKPLIEPQQKQPQAQPGQPQPGLPGQTPKLLDGGPQQPQPQQLMEVREAERAALLLELAGWRD